MYIWSRLNINTDSFPEGLTRVYHDKFTTYDKKKSSLMVITRWKEWRNPKQTSHHHLLPARLHLCCRHHLQSHSSRHHLPLPPLLHAGRNRLLPRPHRLRPRHPSPTRQRTERWRSSLELECCLGPNHHCSLAERGSDCRGRWLRCRCRCRSGSETMPWRQQNRTNHCKSNGLKLRGKNVEQIVVWWFFFNHNLSSLSGLLGVQSTSSLLLLLASPLLREERKILMLLPGDLPSLLRRTK